MTTPPWDPYGLMMPFDHLVRGPDASEAVHAVMEAEDKIEMGEHDGMMVFRQPRAIVMLPWTRHVHDHECFRA